MTLVSSFAPHARQLSENTTLATFPPSPSPLKLTKTSPIFSRPIFFFPLAYSRAGGQKGQPNTKFPSPLSTPATARRTIHELCDEFFPPYRPYRYCQRSCRTLARSRSSFFCPKQDLHPLQRRLQLPVNELSFGPSRLHWCYLSSPDSRLASSTLTAFRGLNIQSNKGDQHSLAPLHSTRFPHSRDPILTVRIPFPQPLFPPCPFCTLLPPHPLLAPVLLCPICLLLEQSYRTS